MKSTCYRQGDVFLIPVCEIVEGAERQHRHGVLAEGEVTGHSHRFAVPDGADVFKVGDGLFVDVLVDDAELVHQEHGTIRLPRGPYQVRIQREYTPKGIQRVVD